jgi:hypothetical protein
MRQFDSYRAVTLRANRIDYISPVVCELEVIASGSGSSSSGSAILPVPVVRKDGPTNLIVTVQGSSAVLTWSEQSYIYAYAVYAGPSSEGPFVLLTTNVLGNTATVGPGAGIKFFKVTGLEPEFGETYPSNIVGPVIIP